MDFILFLFCQVPAPDPSSAEALSWLFLKTVFVMIAVIGLAFLTLRYILPKLTRITARKDSRITVLDHQPLDNRKSIYVVSIHGRNIALGVTDQNISRLAEWQDDERKAT